MDRASYDTVVVGAGAAGCVVAARLAAGTGRHVLLLDAGPVESTPAIDAGDFLATAGDTDRGWSGVARGAADGRAVPYRLGRGIGGGSAVNGMLASVAPDADYDRWSALGATGWTAARLRPWFDAAFAGELPLVVRLASAGEEGPLRRAVRTVFGSGPAREGLTLDAHGRRAGAARYAARALDAGAGLVVRGDAAVEHVVLDGARARGVVLRTGEQIRAGEVVLAAGAVHTPLVLRRSGIVLPGLGQNLLDHPAVALALAMGPSVEGASASSRAISGSAVLSSEDGDGNDVQLVPIERTRPCPDPDEASYGVLVVGLLDSHARGRVEPRADGRPLLTIDLLSDPGDRRRLRAGVRRAVAGLGEPAMVEVVQAAYADDRGTPAAALAALDDDALDGWLAGALSGHYHAAGTCRMGPLDDALAVCDTSGRVIGHEALRVVDASLFPSLPRSGPMLTCVAVAESLAATWDGE